jgi:hypothetical protein
MTLPVATKLIDRIGMGLVYVGLFVVVTAAGLSPFMQAL